VTTNDFEGALRGQMKAHAAEFDRMVGPAPQLRTLLAGRRSAGRRSAGRVGRFTAFRLSVAVAAVAAATFAVVVLALIFGSVLAQPLPNSSPLSSVTPSPLPLVSLLSSPSAEAAGPTASPQPTASAGVPTVLVEPTHGDGFVWASGGGHKASVWR
jgi:hypothetical protein